MADIDPELRAWAERQLWGDDGELIPLIRVEHIFRVAEAAWNERGAVDAARRLQDHDDLCSLVQEAELKSKQRLERYETLEQSVREAIKRGMKPSPHLAYALAALEAQR